LQQPLVSEKHGRREVEYYAEGSAVVAREKNQHCTLLTASFS
jgi:hypothetical protein